MTIPSVLVYIDINYVCLSVQIKGTVVKGKDWYFAACSLLNDKSGTENGNSVQINVQRTKHRLKVD